GHAGRRHLPAGGEDVLLAAGRVPRRPGVVHALPAPQAARAARAGVDAPPQVQHRGLELVDLDVGDAVLGLGQGTGAVEPDVDGAGICTWQTVPGGATISTARIVPSLISRSGTSDIRSGVMAAPTVVA